MRARGTKRSAGLAADAREQGGWAGPAGSPKRVGMIRTAGRADGHDAAIVDLRVLSELLGGDANACLAVLRTFAVTSPREVDGLLAAASEADLGGIKTRAHRLKAAARSIGAAPVAELCAALEEQAAEAHFAELHQSVRRLQAEWPKLEQALDIAMARMQGAGA